MLPLIWTNSFSHEQPIFYKIRFNNYFNYPNILTNQTDFCFPKLYFSLSVPTKIVCINKQLLVDVIWPNKTICKSSLNKATKDVLLFEKSFWKVGPCTK